jgi:hypothetical protein
MDDLRVGIIEMVLRVGADFTAARFFEALQAFDRRLASGTPLSIPSSPFQMRDANPISVSSLTL